MVTETKEISDKESAGLDKGGLSYYESEKGFGCPNCVFYRGDGELCDVVSTPVHDSGCCDYWEDNQNATYNGPKLNVSTVVYLEEESPSRLYVCGECKFIKTDGECDVVKHSVSAIKGTCNAWEKQLPNMPSLELTTKLPQ